MALFAFRIKKDISMSLIVTKSCFTLQHVIHSSMFTSFEYFLFITALCRIICCKINVYIYTDLILSSIMKGAALSFKFFRPVVQAGTKRLGEMRWSILEHFSKNLLFEHLGDTNLLNYVYWLYFLILYNDLVQFNFRWFFFCAQWGSGEKNFLYILVSFLCQDQSSL